MITEQPGLFRLGKNTYMTKDEAIKLIESLIEANMAQGVFKKFEVLDKVRMAVNLLKTLVEPGQE